MLLLVTVLQAVHGDGDIKLDVHVKNYTSKYSYKIAREFTGYVNSTCSTHRFPIEGYLYTIENTTGPGYPPFRPNSTWIAFVPSSIDHLSLSLAASIRSAGYSVIMLDSSLSADTDVSEVNIPLVSVVNATEYFFALSHSKQIAEGPSVNPWFQLGANRLRVCADDSLIRLPNIRAYAKRVSYIGILRPLSRILEAPPFRL